MVISRTPLRISLAGGGSDFADFYQAEGGAVLSAAIDRYVYICVNPSFDGKVRLNYSKKEEVGAAHEVRHDLVREAMQLTGIKKGVEISTMADIPSEGSGLGSSSAVTVGLLHALYRYAGREADPETLAWDACHIEIDRLRAPVGKQDQYIAAYGGLRLFHFHRDEQVSSEPVRLPALRRLMLGEQLLLFYTGRGRKAASVLAEQQARIPATRPLLRQLRDQVMPMQAALLSGSLARVGQLLDEGWQLKKQLAGGISTPALDRLIHRAKAAGATGGKIAGAGGGGFLLLACPPERREAVRQALPDLAELSFGLAAPGSQLIYDSTAA